MNVAVSGNKKPHQQERRQAAANDQGSAQHTSDSQWSVSARGAVCDSQVVEEGACELSTMGLVSFPKVILPAFLGSCVPAYIFWDLARNRKIFGGTVPHTIQGSEWERETDRKMDAWPREAAGPVVMNPISRQNYNKA